MDAVRYMSRGDAAFNALSIDLRYQIPMRSSSVQPDDHDDDEATREGDRHRPASCDNSSSSSRWSQHSLLVERYLGWEDFKLPPETHHEVRLQQMVGSS